MTPARFWTETRVKLRGLGYGEALGRTTMPIFIATAIGLVTGLMAVAFKLGLSWLTDEVRQVAPHGTLAGVLAPALGGLGAGVVIWLLAGDARGGGVANVIDAVARRGGLIRRRTVLGRILASGMTIGSGGIAGIEGPIVQIGAGLGSTLGRYMRVERSRMRRFVAVGAAGGVSAVFNAPLAGALFAIEVILGSGTVKSMLMVVTSAIVAQFVDHLVLGEVVALTVPKHFIPGAHGLLFSGLVGLAAGVVGALFIKALLRTELHTERWRIPEALKPAVGGLGLGLLLVPLGGFDGLFEAIRDLSAVPDAPGLTTSLRYLLIVLAGTCLTLGTGGSGGVFAPSLALGAALGAVVGQLPAHTFGDGVGVYAILGAGAMVAATTRAPLTSVLIVIEITHDYEILPGLLLATTLAILVSSMLEPESFYTGKLAMKHIRLLPDSPVRAVGHLRARDIYREETTQVHRRATVNRWLLRKLRAGETVYVVDRSGRYLGAVPPGVALHWHEKEILGRRVGELMSHPEPLSLDRPCSDAIHQLALHELLELPVVEGQKLVGKLMNRDIMRALDREIDPASAPMLEIRTPGEDGEEVDFVELEGRTRVFAARVPRMAVGKSLQELDLRERFGVEVVGIREPRDEALVPVPLDPKRPLAAGSVLVCLGLPETNARLVEELGGV